MNDDEVLEAFAVDRRVDLAEVMPEERDAIVQVAACHRAVQVGYANLAESVLEQDMAVGLLWQLFERCTERIEAAIVSMVASCACGGEIIARATIEACATLRYVLLDRNRHLASFLMQHIQYAKSQQDKWRKAAARLGPSARDVHLAACEYRARATGVLEGVVKQVNDQLLKDGEASNWPNIADRFEKLGESIDYRTFYARLCAETHLDAEETLRYFFGKICGPDVFNALATETAMYSRMMLAEAAFSYAYAGAAYSRAYSMTAAEEICVSAQQIMARHVRTLAGGIGAGPVLE